MRYPICCETLPLRTNMIASPAGLLEHVEFRRVLHVLVKEGIAIGEMGEDGCTFGEFCHFYP